MSSVRNRLLHGMGANGFGQGVNVLVQLISVPLFVSFWGVQLYGEWLILSTIPAYLSMSDMGFSSVAGNKMTMLVAGSNRTAALQIFQSTWTLLTAVCLVIVVIASATPLVPIRAWLNLSALEHDQVSIILLLLSLAVAINLQRDLLSAGFRCEGGYALAAWISNLSRLCEFIIVAIVLYLGAGPIFVSAIFFVCRTLSFLLSYYILRKSYRWVQCGYSNASIADIREMIRPSFAFMAFPIGNALKSQGMLTIVGVTLGPAMAVAFSSMRTLVNASQQAMGIINSAVWPEMSRAFGAQNIQLARKLHRISCKISFWFALFAIAFLALFGRQIIDVWTLGKVLMDPVFFNYLLFVTFVNSFWFTSSVVLAATNRHENMAILYMATSICSVLIALMITPLLGLTGIALSLSIIELAMTAYVLRASLILVGDSYWSFGVFIANPFKK